MKTVHYVLSLGTVSLLVGCAAPPVSLGPVGPNPVGSKTQALAGELQVFSRVAEKFDDQERVNSPIIFRDFVSKCLRKKYKWQRPLLRGFRFFDWNSVLSA